MIIDVLFCIYRHVHFAPLLPPMPDGVLPPMPDHSCPLYRREVTMPTLVNDEPANVFENGATTQWRICLMSGSPCKIGYLFAPTVTKYFSHLIIAYVRETIWTLISFHFNEVGRNISSARWYCRRPARWEAAEAFSRGSILSQALLRNGRTPYQRLPPLPDVIGCIVYRVMQICDQLTCQGVDPDACTWQLQEELAGKSLFRAGQDGRSPSRAKPERGNPYGLLHCTLFLI